MVRCIHSVIFFIFFVSFYALSCAAEDSDKEAYHQCGHYGFLCLGCGKLNFEAIKRISMETKLEKKFICSDGLVCDEEKTEYCSPVVKISSRNCSKSAKIIRRKARSQRKNQSVGNDTDEQIWKITTMQTTLENDENSFDQHDTTESSVGEKWKRQMPITCTMYGFYPGKIAQQISACFHNLINHFIDNINSSRFFFCDLKENGKSFKLRHMQCGQNRYFDSNFKDCILNGTTRNTRKDVKTSVDKADESKIIDLPNSSFNCTDRIPGKYSDPHSCHIYHICLTKNIYAPFERLTVECPKHTAFDPHSKACTKRANKACETPGISCSQQIRLREIRSCKHYFLCFGNQIVNFKCPNGFEFDDNFEICMPEHFVECN